jgi:tRNA A37 threonylcarbamoyladenosine modification protein TsaB
MYLVIDNTAGEELVVFISEDGKAWAEHKFCIEKNELLISIEKVLEKEKRKIEDLKGIAVKVGKGKFTGTRLAVTIGNTLAFALKIPVIARTVIDPRTVVDEIKKTPVGQYALPVYSGEPRIGGK